MAKVPIQIRVEASDLENWQREARGREQSVSEFIRERCNANDRALDVPRNGTVRVARRRVNTVAGPHDAGGNLGGGSAPVYAEGERVTGESEVVDGNVEELDWAEAMIMRKSGHPRGCDCAMVCGKLRAALKPKEKR